MVTDVATPEPEDVRLLRELVDEWLRINELRERARRERDEDLAAMTEGEKREAWGR